MAPGLPSDPGIVETIYISTFGFSRGATQARAFANWLDSLCQLDARIRGEGTSSLGGFPVEFDFLGLFDTVASVGLGNTLGNFPLLRAADGHGAWADAEDSLRIPSCIRSCVHLVAGHELRRSFPCDSIAVGFTLPYPATGGGTIAGVSLTSGPKKISWRLDGPPGTSRNGETVRARNSPRLDNVPHDARYLSMHIYPDETVELVVSSHYPRATDKGRASAGHRREDR